MPNLKRAPSALNTYEQLSLLRQPNPGVPTGLRNLCIISLMLKLGLRVNEIINLKDSDIDWQKGEIYVRRSGAALDRTLRVGEAELFLLKRWLQTKPKGTELLFTTLKGEPLKDRYIREMTKRLARKAGIAKDVYPHLLRVTFAVDFMRETGDLKLLQHALGHRDLTATQGYARLFLEQSRFPYITGFYEHYSGMPLNYHRQHSESGQYQERSAEADHFKKGEEHKENALSSPAENVAALSFNSSIKNGVEEEEEHQAKETGGETDGRKEEGAAFKEKSEFETTKTPGKVHKTFEKDDKEEAEETVSACKAQPLRTGTGAESEEKVPIPPLKCSGCNYILRYKENCPQCGTAFETTLKHWRSNI